MPSETEKYGYLCGSIAKKRTQNEKNPPIHISLIIALLALTTCIPTSMAQTVACTARPPKHEVRAVWLTTIGGIDWPHTYAQSARSIENSRTNCAKFWTSCRLPASTPYCYRPVCEAP